jgi:hypothetical protein
MDTPAYRQTPQVAAASSPVAAAPAGDRPEALPPAVSGSGHRGLYIALGAFIVVAVLFAAGLYLPSRIKTLAGAGKSAPASQQASSSATSPSSNTPQASTDATASTPATPASTDPAAPAATAAEAATAAASAQAVQSGQSSPDAANASSATSTDTVPATSAASNSGGASAQPAKKPSAAKSKKDNQAAQADAQAKADEAAAVEENEHRYDDIDSRSAAVSTSLDNIQRQQAAAGYGLRGDIVSAQQRMRIDLGKAQTAMQKQDTKGAKKYLDMAEAELTTIEKFLGK